MSKKNGLETDVKDRIVLSALELSEQKGWEQVTLQDISDHAEISVSEHIDNKEGIIALFALMVDKRVAENLSSSDDDTSSSRDKIFDILMDRYDVLNDHRVGVLSMFKSYKCDPKQAFVTLPNIYNSMRWTLEKAGIETYGVSGAIKVAGLTGIYLKGVKSWMDDDSQDLSKTMASLDKALDHGESIINSFGI